MSRYVTIGGFTVPEGFAVDEPRHGVFRDGEIVWLPPDYEPPPAPPGEYMLVVMRVDRKTGVVTVSAKPNVR
jgi:hypothetical protein